MFYQRDIASKRLLTSIGIGIITSIVLIIVQLIFTYFIRIIVRIINQRIIKNRRLFQMANAHYVNIRNSVS